MKIRLRQFAGAAFLLVLAGCSSPTVEVGNLKVIPLPQEVFQPMTEHPFVINGRTVVYCQPDDETLVRTAHFVVSYVKELTGIEMEVVDERPSSNVIVLSLSSNAKGKEAYRMDVAENRILIEGGSEAGVFYGVQTLYKALPIVKGTGKVAAVPAGLIDDAPRFPYRGFMIDVGRHYFPVSYLKEMIDLMAMHNINYFHWHLTEDQGWRIEIKKYPKLTEIGSVRDSTLIDPDTREYEYARYGGFYTQDEAREIVRYAAERFITVIPEIDMPGHMMAALASYPELGCTGGPYTIPARFGVHKEVLCVGNPQTLQFAKDVLTEIMDIFPSPYIHIGGDECPKKRWRECPKCQAKIRELGLKDKSGLTKEDQLQGYFTHEIENFLHEKGRKMIGWNEIQAHGDLLPETTIVSWNSVGGGIKAARDHRPAIMAPIQYLYFNNRRWNKIPGVNSVKRVYCFEPVPKELTPEEQPYIVGVEGCLWTEWTKDSLKMEEQLLPRMAALSEIQWTEPDKKDFESFKKRLPAMLEKYTVRGYHYREDIHDTTIVELPVDSVLYYD